MPRVIFWSTHIVTFFEGEIELIGRGENAFKSTRVEQFTVDGSTRIIRGKVQSSLKDIVYSRGTDIRS